MAFLREPTLWDGVFLTRHHLNKQEKLKTGFKYVILKVKNLYGALC